MYYGHYPELDRYAINDKWAKAMNERMPGITNKTHMPGAEDILNENRMPPGMTKDNTMPGAITDMINDNRMPPGMMNERMPPGMMNENRMPAGMMNENRMPTGMMNERMSPGMMNENRMPAGTMSENQTPGMMNERMSPGMMNERMSPGMMNERMSPGMMNENRFSMAVMNSKTPAVMSDSSYDQASILPISIKNIQEALMGETEDKMFYEYLIREAPSSEDKNILSGIRDDEMKHFRMFRQMYYEHTGQMPPQDMTATFEKPASYCDGVRKALMGEQNAVTKYRKILFGMQERAHINMMTEIITDELRHLGLYNYLYSKNDCSA